MRRPFSTLFSSQSCLVLLHDASRHVLTRHAHRLVAAVGGIDVGLAVVEAPHLLPVLGLVERLVPLRAALHRRLVGLEPALTPETGRADRIREVRAPVAGQIGMPVGIARRLASWLSPAMTKPSCGETRLPHGAHEHCTLRIGRLPGRCAAGGSCDAPLAGAAGCCAAVRPGATAMATAIAHAAGKQRSDVLAHDLLLNAPYSSTTTYSLPATVIERMNPSLAPSGSFHAGEMR